MGYDYLMYAEPIYLRFTDGTQLKLQVTARARREYDILAFSVNDRVTSKLKIDSYSQRLTFRYQEDGFNLRVKCIPRESEDKTPNHFCTVYSANVKLGVLDVINRIYPAALNESADDNDA